MDIVRIVASCDAVLLRQLIAKIAADDEPSIDWSLKGRELGHAAQRAASEHPQIWVKLQKIAALSIHGTRATIRSVLLHDTSLRQAFDALEANKETATVWLALKDDGLFEYCLSALHADRGLYKRSWKAFQVAATQRLRLDFAEMRQQKFEALVRDAIRNCSSFDAPGELETHYFRRTIRPRGEHQSRHVHQVTVFAEARWVTDESFVRSRVQTLARKKVDSISVIYDRDRRELDVVTIGGKPFIREVADGFMQAFAGTKARLQALAQRPISLNTLLQPFRPTMPEPCRFENAKVDQITLRSPSGGLYTIDAKGYRGSLDVYDMAKRDFGTQTPFEHAGWQVISARILLCVRPSKPHAGPKFRAIELKAHGYTNLREQDDEDRYIADELLTAWGLLGSHWLPEPDEDLIGIIAALLWHAGHEIAADPFASLDQIGCFVKAGWLVRADTPATVPCEVCEDAHSAEVVEIDGAARGVCPRTGKAFPVVHNLSHVRVDGNAFARSLSRALRVDGDARPIGGLQTVWRLGARAVGDARVIFFFVPSLDGIESATTVLEAITHQAQAMRFAVIVADDIDQIRLLQRGGSVVALRDLAAIRPDGTLEIDEARLVARVVPEAARARRPGRPASQRELLLPIIDELISEGVLTDASNSACGLVKARFNERHPGAVAPARNTVRDVIRGCLGRLMG